MSMMWIKTIFLKKTSLLSSHLIGCGRHNREGDDDKHSGKDTHHNDSNEELCDAALKVRKRIRQLGRG